MHIKATLEQEGDSIWEKSGDMLNKELGIFFAFSWSVSEDALFGESARNAKASVLAGTAGVLEHSQRTEDAAWAAVVAISRKQ